MAVIRPVAGEAFVGKNREDITVELDLTGVRHKRGEIDCQRREEPVEPLESHAEHSRAGNRAKKNGTCHTSAFQTLPWRLLRETWFLWPKTAEPNLPGALTTGNRGISRIHFLAQYEVLREHGHSPSEAYNETIEEALQSLYPLVAEKGMDWMYANCSTTAQRGALDWAPRFRDVIKPVVEKCYQSVLKGTEAKISINSNSQNDYREKLEKELEEVSSQEMWQAGKVLRKLRPENL